MEEEKEILLYSESYPLNEKKERIHPKAISQVHKLLKGVKLDLNKIYYKPLGPEHYEEVQNLHKEWFPVAYPQKIFVNSLLYNQGGYMTQGAFYFLEEEKKEVILGLIIAEWRPVDKNFALMVNKNVLDEIYKSLNYEEEVQLYLSKKKYYYINYIVSIGVIDECRKMNIGTNLIKYIFNYSIYIPLCTGVYLHVISDNFVGKKFYDKLGMNNSGYLENFYDIEGKKYASNVYVKIFSKEDKNNVRKMQRKMLTFKQKCSLYLIWKPYFILVKLFMIFCLCRCFKNGIDLD